MTKGIDDKKSRVGGVRGAAKPEDIQKTGAVSGVEQAKKTAPVVGVRAVGSAGSVGGAQALTSERRAQIFNLIQEEADKLFSGKTLPPGHRQIVEEAVKMTIDAAIPAAAENDKGKQEKDEPQ